MIAAGVDCGTNTLKLLVADLDPTTGRATDLVREARAVRLGEGVDASGRLSQESLERVFAVVEEYAGVVAEHGAERVRCCATSAVRDAGNADVLLRGVAARLGVTPQVLSGEEEARLCFAGVRRSLAGAEPPLLVVDVGGGSTEVVLGGGDGEVLGAASLDVGSVRLTERFVRADPPTAAHVAAVRDHVDAALDTLPALGVDLARARTVVAVSGTALTLGAGVLGLPALDPAALHLRTVTAEQVAHHVEDLLAMSVAERDALPVMLPGRADVIGAGGVVLERLLARVPADEVTLSVSDILDGITWTAATP